MIARLRGEIIEIGHNRLVVDCHGVGYEVIVSERTLSAAGIVGDHADLYIRHIVREDDQSLYGFTTPTERRLFDILREVKGCGAKISLAILGTLGQEVAVGNIATQDVKGLSQTPGVGPRLAERIIVELKDKIQEFQFDQKIAAASINSRPLSQKPEDELVEALVSLGYRRAEAEEAADNVNQQADTVNERLRLALKRLAK